MSRFFYHDRPQLVSEALEGIIISTPYQNLTRLDLDPAMRVVARKNWDKSKVAVISGGGAGHEPAHVGFVGKGMLTAAVCGDLFASPSVDAVYNAIMNLTGEAGCLLIVKNYTGDRLNFGLAAEKAKKAGRNVEMVMVGDDIALPDNKQPRGIAGTVLVHKLAGHAAEQGQPLAKVLQAAKLACANIFSLGVALQTCHLPDSTGDESRIKPDQAELGLGIHGEPGARVIDTQDSRLIIEQLVAPLREAAGSDVRLGVMLNNLGGTSPLEMAQLAQALSQSSLARQTDYLIGPACMVTALDMKGFSLTVIRLTETIITALASPVEAAGWQPIVPLRSMAVTPAQLFKDEVLFTPSSDAVVGACVDTVTRTLIENEAYLNTLDARIGDGDTGSTFAEGARDIADLNRRGALPLRDLATLLELIGDRLSTVMGGSSGVLMSIFFTAAGQSVRSGKRLAEALLVGLMQMKQYGGADLGDRTLIDALQPALEALHKGGSLGDAAQAAQEGAQATAQMEKAGAGRSSYVNSQNLDGVVDPGAAAVAAVFRQLAG